MAEVALTVGGYTYKVACRDGDEANLAHLAERVDAKVTQLKGALGNAGEARLLLLAALLLADEAKDAAESQNDVIQPEAVEALAEKIEALATRVEKLADKA